MKFPEDYLLDSYVKKTAEYISQNVSIRNQDEDTSPNTSMNNENASS